MPNYATIYFVNPSAEDYEFAKEFLGDLVNIQRINLDIPVICSTSIEKLVENETRAAYSLLKDNTLVIRRFLLIGDLDGFPGVCTHYLESHQVLKKITKLFSKLDNRNAILKLVAGVHYGHKLGIFTYELKGSVGSNNNPFKVEDIFIPENTNAPLSENPLLLEEVKKQFYMKVKGFVKGILEGKIW